MLIPKAVDQCLSLLFIQSQATIPQCIYSIALSLCLNPSSSLWLYHHFVIKLCTLEGNFHGLSFLWLTYRAAKKTSIALFSGLPFFCSNNQSICYFPSWGLQAHLWKGYQSSATASAPLPSKHTVMLISSFVHPTPFACTPASCFISHQVSPPCCHWHQLCCLLFSFLWCFNVLTNTGLYTHTPSLHLSTRFIYPPVILILLLSAGKSHKTSPSAVAGAAISQIRQSAVFLSQLLSKLTITSFFFALSPFS